MKSFISWSGGKDASLSYYKAVCGGDIEAACLLNMISEDGEHSRTHGISSSLLKLQAEAIGIPIMQRKSSWADYETEFKKAVLDLKKKDIQSGIFGDIDLDEHRRWVERVSNDCGISPVFPLWQKRREKLLSEFIDAGFEAIVVAVKSDVLGPEWLGRKIDESFVSDLKKIKTIDLCGEAGEYHTLVYNGPIFKKSVNFTIGNKIPDNKRLFLELLPGKN